MKNDQKILFRGAIVTECFGVVIAVAVRNYLELVQRALSHDSAYIEEVNK